MRIHARPKRTVNKKSVTLCLSLQALAAHCAASSVICRQFANRHRKRHLSSQALTARAPKSLSIKKRHLTSILCRHRPHAAPHQLHAQPVGAHHRPDVSRGALNQRQRKNGGGPGKLYFILSGGLFPGLATSAAAPNWWEDLLSRACSTSPMSLVHVCDCIWRRCRQQLRRDV